MEIYAKRCTFVSSTSVPTETVISGYAGSTAQTYAAKFNREFVELGTASTSSVMTTALTTTSLTQTTTTTTTASSKTSAVTSTTPESFENRLIGDVNGDGKVKVTVKGIWLALDFETQDAALQRLMQSSEDKLNSDFYLCESTLFIVDDPTAMEQRYGCFQTLDGTDPEDGDVLSVADFALPLQDTALANDVQSESLPSGTPLAA